VDNYINFLSSFTDFAWIYTHADKQMSNVSVIAGIIGADSMGHGRASASPLSRMAGPGGAP